MPKKMKMKTLLRNKNNISQLKTENVFNRFFIIEFGPTI